MKSLLFFLLVLVSFQSKAQVLSGKLVDDKRKIIGSPSFTIVSNYEGHVVYEIAVDITGKVTGLRFIAEKSTVLSTPANMEAKNLLKTLTFEAAEYFPKFHHAIVKVTFTKK